jgi:ABC-type glutathione transport system ATPase component
MQGKPIQRERRLLISQLPRIPGKQEMSGRFLISWFERSTAGMIKMTHLSKDFRLREEPEGLAGQLKALIHPRWRVIHALDNVSLAVKNGEIIGYLGPNGAGKSTTIKLLTGILHPTSGTVEVNGIVPQRNRTKNAYNIGVVYGFLGIVFIEKEYFFD